MKVFLFVCNRGLGVPKEILGWRILGAEVVRFHRISSSVDLDIFMGEENAWIFTIWVGGGLYFSGESIE